MTRRATTHRLSAVVPLRRGRITVLALAVPVALAGCAYVGASEITRINTTTKPVVVSDFPDRRFLVGACETRTINPDNRGDQIDRYVPLPSDAVDLWQQRFRLPNNFEMRVIATVAIPPSGLQNPAPANLPSCVDPPPDEPSPSPSA